MPAITIQQYRHEHARAAVTMWRNSKAMVLGIPEMHSFDEHVFFLDQMLTRDNEEGLPDILYEWIRDVTHNESG